MKKHEAFTLLELVFGLAISSMVLVGLYFMLNQSLTSFGVIDRLTSSDRAVLTVYHRLEEDFAGMTVPMYAPLTPEQQAALEQAPAEKKPLFTPYPEYLVLTSDQTRFKEMSFISTNPVKFYQAIVPCLVRVTYQLVEDQQQPGTYMLRRGQSANLLRSSVSEYFTLLIGIRQMRVRYSFLPSQTADKEPKPVEATQFPISEAIPTREGGAPLPLMVTVELTTVSEKEEREQSYIYKFLVPTAQAQVMLTAQIEEAKKAKSKKKEQPKAEPAESARQQAGAQTGVTAATTTVTSAATPNGIHAVAELLKTAGASNEPKT